MPFEPIAQQPKKPAFEPVENFSPYNYIPGEEGDNIFIPKTGETIKAPQGSGQFFADIQDDDTFDISSNVFEETAASFEKQAAWLGLLANAYGIIGDDETAGFVADRSRALASAQKRQPDYMQEFNRQFEDAKGFFETAAVFVSNPRALGRSAITNSPNAIIPIITTYAGASAGAAAGGAAGSIVPGAGTVVGAGSGALIGGALGAIPGGAIVEIGSTIDQLLIESGVDVTNAAQVAEALANDRLMNDIKIKAEKKGITTAAVDGLFQIFGGRFLKAAKGSGVVRKGMAGAADVGVQAVGEFSSEAAGQQVAFGKVDYKDAAFEAVTSIAQSVGQTATGATIGQTKHVITAVTPKKEVEAIVENIKTQERAITLEDTLEEQGLNIQEMPSEVIKNAEELLKLDNKALDDIEVESVQEFVEEINDKRAELIEQRRKAEAPIIKQMQEQQARQIENIQSETDDIKINALREIENIKQQVESLDLETKEMLEQTSELLSAKRKIKKPQSLGEFIKSKGGLIEKAGEGDLAAIGVSKQRLAKWKETGMTIDEMGELAFEQGFFSERPTTAEFLDAFSQDLKGRPVFSELDANSVVDIDSIEAALSQLDEALDKKGISFNRELLSDLRRRASKNRKLNKQMVRNQAKIEKRLSILKAAEAKLIESPPKILADKLATFRRGLRSGEVIGRKQVKVVQESIIEMLNNSNLLAEDKGKFLGIIKNTQTLEQLDKNLAEIEARVSKLIENAERKQLVGALKKALKKAKIGKTVAADYRAAIKSLVEDLDAQVMRPETRAKLEKTKEYFDKNPSNEVPRHVAKKLERLNKSSIKDISVTDLRDLLAQVKLMEKLGKTKQALKEKARIRRRENRLLQLRGIKKLETKPLVEASLGEKLSIMDSFKNSFTEAANKARQVSLALNPMDVFFDMIDNGKQYQGAAHRIFKQTIDNSFQNYLQRKESITRDVKNLADELKLEDVNFERVGVYATLQQKGGKEKLSATGIMEKELKRLKLTDGEMQFYNLIRERLDSMYPDINNVMVSVYNKNVAQVENYFPFMTDFEKMNDVEIQDMVGDNVPSIALKKKNVEKGFTETRVGGKNAIKINAMDVFLQHVDNAAYLIDMGQDIKELAELAKTEQFKSRAGDLGQRFTIDWLDILARKGGAPNRIKILDQLRINTGAAVLGYKLSTILVQPTSLLDGAALIGGNYVARGVKNIVSSKEWRKFLKTNFSEIRERVGDDPAYLDLGGKSKIAKLREVGFYALQQIDVLAASSVAAGAYIKSVESRGGVVDLNNVDADAVREAQLLMRRTQSSAFAKDNPMIISAGKLTGNASLDKLIFQFQSFVLNRWSLIKHDVAGVGVSRKLTTQSANAAMFLLLANIAELGLRRLNKELIDVLFESDLEPWEETIDEDAVRTLLGNVPIAGSLISSAEYGSNPVPSISLIDSIFRKLQYASRSEDENKKLKHTIGALMLTSGALFGIPGTLQAEQMTRISTDKKVSSGF